MINFDAPSFNSLSSMEWIITNGIGGYASSSVCGANTRRYHGLLIASYRPPTDRRVLVSKIEETILCSETRYSLSTNQYPGTVHPQGFTFLKSFERTPFPKSYFSAEQFSITKTVFMIYGSNTTVIEYQNSGNDVFELELIPLMVDRDYHQLMHEFQALEFNSVLQNSNQLKITSQPGADPVYIFFDKGRFTSNEDWYRNFEYQKEIDRGLDFNEDAKKIGEINFKLNPGEKAFVILSTDGKLPDGHPSTWKAHEEIRLRSLSAMLQPDFVNDLIISGDQFLVWRLSSKSHTLIAGYHWFTDWGRDTMIAMRGLIIATGKKQIAESIFLTFLNYVDGGMIPNRFPDQGEHPEYNTIDATLWLFIALYEYDQKFNDETFIRRVMPALTSIVEKHELGTRYNIHITEEGLLYGGEEGTQLTWMDAKVGDHVVTPRRGCAVEINALWYNTLKIYCEFGEKLRIDIPESIFKSVDRTRVAFQTYFVNEKGYLNDVVIPYKFIDDAIRPNQVYAVSLPFSPLTPQQSESVLKTVEEHLYTDYGLRSLSPSHPDFKPVFKGDQWERDHAYHQGTVWSYLWGEYALAYLKVNGYSLKAKQIITEKSKKLEYHFYNEDGLYAISENFDGEIPGMGKGCIQQAWSIGMTLKALLACSVE